MKILIEESVLRQALETFTHCYAETDRRINERAKILVELRTVLDAAEKVEDQLAAMTKERDYYHGERDLWAKQLVASQAREQQLREALETLHPPGAITEFESLILEPLFTIPHDTSALLHASHEESLRQDAMVKDAARRVVELEISLRIKTEEHNCCAEDNIELRQKLAAMTKERDAAIQEGTK